MKENNDEIQDRLQVFSQVSAQISVLIAAAVLMGWALDAPWLERLSPQFVSMKPLTAICFVMCGCALWLGRTARFAGSARGIAARVFALVAAMAGAATIVEFASGRNFAFEEFFFRRALLASQTVHPGRMSLATSVAFVLLGMALAAMNPRSHGVEWIGQGLALLVVFLSLVHFLGYLYGVSDLNRTFHNNTMAVHTTTLFLMLGLGVLAARPLAAFAGVLNSSQAGGWMARRVLPIAIVLTALFGWLRLRGEDAGYYGRDFGSAVFASLTIAIFFVLVWASARSLNSSAEVLDAAKGELATKEERFQRLVESSDDAIIGKTLEGVITSWNSGAERIFGYTAAEAVGEPMLMLIPQEREEEEKVILERLARGERVDHFETVRQCKDGRRIYISATISPLKDRNGKVVGISKIARDVTERKLAEEKAVGQLKRLYLLNQITRAIGDHLDVASIQGVVLSSLERDLSLGFGCICEYDVVGRQLRVAKIAGHSLDLAERMELGAGARIEVDSNGLQRSITGHLVYEPDASRVDAPFPQRLARAGLLSLVIAPLQVESKVFSVLVAARQEPNAFSSGECEFLRQLCEHAALAAHQAQLHEALRQAYEELRTTQQAVLQQERLRALGQMASGIAHDINNALSPVAIYIESILEAEQGLSAKSRKRLEIMQRAIEDVAQTISRMREFYRQRGEEVRLAATSINALVEQVIELTRVRWCDIPQQRGVVIEMRAELCAALPCVRGDESEIRDALTNLMFNAVDAMPDGGVLTVRTRVAEGPPPPSGTRPERIVVVEVSDTGCGMDEDTRRRCIEPFFTTKGERGTGLGLAMVFGMAQRHDADLEIESEPGKGTTLRVSFPVPSDSPSGSAEQNVLRRPATRLRILIVDDDPVLLHSLAEILESDGHTVVATGGGAAGIEAFRSALGNGEPFAVVLTDLGMPHVSGREVASAVKSASPSTPVILLTGWGQRLSAEGGIPAHVDQLLSKPPKLGELREALEVCQGRREKGAAAPSGNSQPL